MNPDVERAVWEAVRYGDRKGTAVSPGVVFARTGTRLTHDQLRQAVEALLADGRLYWRGQRVHRRLLAGPWPQPQPDLPPPSLFDEEVRE